MDIELCQILSHKMILPSWVNKEALTWSKFILVLKLTLFRFYISLKSLRNKLICFFSWFFSFFFYWKIDMTHADFSNKRSKSFQKQNKMFYSDCGILWKCQIKSEWGAKSVEKMNE